MGSARVWLPLARQVVLLLSLAVVALGAAMEPVRAAGLEATSQSGVGLPQALERALRSYGWRPEAMAYIISHTHLVETPDGAGSPCPSAMACSVRDGTVYVNQSPSNAATFDYVLNHEYIHAMEFARGSADGTIGSILADVLTLSNDADYPLAAYAARRVLGLTGRDDHAVITTQDWFHIEHYILEDVGWDVANLPEWYRQAYFPYLMPGAAARQPVTPTPAPRPNDSDLRMQRVLDAIVNMCGPVLPGARLGAPGVACAPRPSWSGVPYAAMTGRAAPPPPVLAPAPAQGPAAQTIQASIPPAAAESVQPSAVDTATEPGSDA